MTHDPREAMKPCPFCGDEPSISTRMDEDIWTHNIVEWTHVSCAECGIHFEWPPGADPDAVAQWNTRALTASPGEQEPCGWQFCCPDGKWIGCDEPPANELRDEPEKFRRVYLSPPQAAGWNEAIEAAAAAAEADEGTSTFAISARVRIARCIRALRREAPAPEGVSTPSAAAESNASVEARLREAIRLSVPELERARDYNNAPNSVTIKRLKESLSSAGDEEKKSEGAPAREPGMGWELSDETRARLAEIDDNLRNAAINASNIVAGNPSSPTAERREIVVQIVREAMLAEPFRIENFSERAIRRCEIAGNAADAILAALDGVQ